MTADAHTDSSKAAAFDDEVLRYWAPVLARMPRPGPYLVVDMRPPGPRAMSATSEGQRLFASQSAEVVARQAAGQACTDDEHAWLDSSHGAGDCRAGLPHHFWKGAHVLSS